jgi:hypothetical protein
MPLQIRRGTDAERLGSFTPVEGELIYTTDTKKLYVGDGATVGGVAIDTVSSGGGGGASVLNDLSDVIIETLNDGDVLTYDGVNWSADSIGNIISLDDLSGVVIETVNAGDVLTYDGVNWTADSVEGVSSLDDLSDVVIENAVSGSILKYDGVNWTVGVDDSGVTSINDLSDVFIENAVSGSMLTYDGVNWAANNSDINITGDVITSGDVTANVVYADFHGPSFGDVFADDSTTKLVDATTQIFNGAVTGDVTGNVTGDVTGNVTGNVVGNATGNHTGTFNGDVNGNITGNIYTNLITPTTQQIIVKNDTPNDNMSVKINSNDDRSILKLTRQSTSDLTGVDSQYGAILFERTDVNGSLVTSGIFGQEDFLLFGNSADGDMTTDDKLFVWRDNKFGIGTAFPTEELEVVGDTKISGFVQFGSLTTLERDALTAANGMVIYNSTDNKFQGYENGAWVNLV